MAPRRRRRPAVAGVLLTHGAGSDRDHPVSLAIEERLAPLPVVRMNFPYRTKPGKRPPDRAPVLLASLHEQLDELCQRLGVGPESIVIGGRSMGGRICTMVAAEPTPVAGVVPISYPLHPPGKSDRLRVEHFPTLASPCLFISGERDPFGSPDELMAATAAIPGPVEHRWFPGGHDIKRADAAIAELVADWIGNLR